MTDCVVVTATLAGWIARGFALIPPLKDPTILARPGSAGLGRYCEDVTWEGDEGDLAIDSEHLRMIADHRAAFPPQSRTA